MATRKEALIPLRDKVRDGEKFIAQSCKEAGFTEFQASRAEAITIHGSLDAALALHEAVLPGWDWGRWAASKQVYVWNEADGMSGQSWAEPPARAWLLAILEALIKGECK